MDKILVVNVNWMGDVVFSSSVFKALKEQFPESQLSCLAVPRVVEILESIPYIDEIIVYDERGIHKSILSKIKLIFKIQQKRFNAAFLLHRSLTRAVLVFLARIPIRVGYDTKGRGAFLTHKIDLPRNNLHRSDCYLKVIESFGIKINDRKTLLSISAEADQRIEKMLIENNISHKDFLIVVNPGGNWEHKRWDKHNYTFLIERLSTELNAKVIISGSKKDIDLSKEILRFLKHKPLNLSGKINLKELIALMKRADLVISADSGPLHIANSVCSRAIGLFGPTSINVTGPRGQGEFLLLKYDVGCNREACYHLECNDNICMQAITVEDVIYASKRMQNK